jgi:hypothetical protein
MDKRRGGKKEKRKKKKRRGEKKKKKNKGNLDILQPQYNGEAVLPNVFENGSSFTREATPPEELEPELLSKEPEPCQTDLNVINSAQAQTKSSLPIFFAHLIQSCSIHVCT